MNDSPSDPRAASADGQRDPVEALVEQFFQRRRAGEPLTVEQFARQHSRWAADIRDLLPALIAVEDLQDDASGESAGAEPPDAPPLKQLGDFRIVREIGRGGMGVVYEAEQVSLGRRVAVKVLPRPVALDSRHKRRFRREARAAARLHHTNIVPVFSVDRQDGLLFYVMQYIHGMGLDAVLGELKRLRHTGDGQAPLPEAAAVAAQGAAAVPFDQLPTVEHPDGLSAAAVAVSLLSGRFERPVRPTNLDSGDSGLPSGGIAPAPAPPVELDHSDAPRCSDPTTDSVVLTLPGSGRHAGQHPTRAVYWQSVARIGAQVAGALHYAHEQGVIHRDVKPANLLLDVRGVTWVADFGLAKAADQRDLTNTGDILGTLRYMAPEQFEGRADARSDVYSLGLTLYELLALRPAFDERDRHVLIHQVTTGTPSRLRTLDRHVPRDLETIVHKAIDRDPTHRYQTAGDLAADLHRYLGDEPIRAKWASPVTRFSRWCKRNPAVALLTVTLLALLMVGTIGSVLAAVMFRDLAQEKASAYTRASDDRDLARKAQDDATRWLFDSSLAEAQASRWSGRPGQRLKAMVAIERASGLIAPLELGEEARAALRDEAIAAMSLADLKRVETWDGP